MSPTLELRDRIKVDTPLSNKPDVSTRNGCGKIAPLASGGGGGATNTCNDDMLGTFVSSKYQNIEGLCILTQTLSEIGIMDNHKRV